MKLTIFRSFKLNPRIAIVALHDITMSIIAFECVLQIRYSIYGAPQPWGFLWQGTLLFAVVCSIVFWRAGLYRGVWHYASLNDLIAILKGVTLAVLIFLPLLFILNRLDAYPRVALPFNWALLIVLLTVPRFMYRTLKDKNFSSILKREDPNSIPVLLVGVGDIAETFIRTMTRMEESPYRILGILDYRNDHIGRNIHGIRVLGLINDISKVVDNLIAKGNRPQRLILADDFEGVLVRQMVDLADLNGLTVSRVPQLTDLRDGDKIEVRKVNVGDLLGRPQKVLDRSVMEQLVAGRKVLVTGAGGTIGRELCSQIASYGPNSLTLLDNGEFNLFSIDMDIKNNFPDLNRSTVLGDIRDKIRLKKTFQKDRPNLVFHAAAFKHVPLSELNPDEVVLTNIIGTRNVVDACCDAGVDTMVLISTDKAVDSSSVMGATKRVAELVCQSAKFTGEGHCITVRFGNVLGSTGSVIPLFERQLSDGVPLTVTHPDATRYFMTTREAVELVLQASTIPINEAGKNPVFILDMGNPIRIQDLARQMIRLSGIKGNSSDHIEYIGLRPGEKLHELLAHENEDLRGSSYEGIKIGNAKFMDATILNNKLNDLEDASRSCDVFRTLKILADLAPESNLEVLKDFSN